jgi:hypothetical protein
MNRTYVLALSATFAMGLATLSGCANDRSSNIPANAVVGSSGDDRLSYTAQSSGTVWVYDVNNDRIDYSGPVAANDSVTVDPGSTSVTVNGRVVTDKLDKNSKHKIYYVAGQQTQAQGS